MSNKQKIILPPAHPMEKPIVFDDLMQIGKYSILIMVFIEFVLLAAAGNMMMMVYAGAAPKSVSCEGDDFVFKNVCSDSEISPRIFAEEENCTLTSQFYFESVNVYWGYFCKDGEYVKRSISSQMFGMLIGTFLAGNLSDRYGRLRVMSVSLIFSSMFAVASLFTNSLESFTFVRIWVLFFNGGLMATFNVYLMEHMPHKYRFWVATIISWAPNFTIIAILAWLTQDWRLLQMVHSFCIIPAFIIILAMRESPRWLIQRGKIFEARRILDRMLQYNNVSDEVYAKMHNLLDSEYRKQMDRPNKVYDMRKLFSRKKMSIATAILCLGKLFTSLVNYGLVFNIDRVSGSIYTNAVITGCLRWATNIVIGVVDHHVEFFGRKIIHFLSQFLIAICMAVIVGVIIYGADPNSSDIVRVATLAATIITSQVFITKSIVTIEYYPTLVRNSAMALSSTCSRIGSIIAPLIFYFTDIPFIPYLILSIAALADAILFQIVLPETKGKHLPDRMPSKKRKPVERPTTLAELEELSPPGQAITER